MAEESLKLTIVIVSWNVKDAVLKNLRNLFASDPMPAFDVILVDNASSDGTVLAVRAAFPSVTIIANKINNGFAKACNQGIEKSKIEIRKSKPSHILLLNPDMRIEPEALDLTIKYLDGHPEVAIVGAKLIGADSKAMHHMRRFPTLGDQLAVTLKLTKFFPHVIDCYLGKDLDLDAEQEVYSLRGSYFAINRTALEKIGGLDERYFIWFEEVDYCRRARQAGMKVMYVPTIVAHDQVGASFAKQDLLWKQRQFRRSMLAYFRKWYSLIDYILLWLAWMLIWPVVLLSSRAKRSGEGSLRGD